MKRVFGTRTPINKVLTMSALGLVLTSHISFAQGVGQQNDSGAPGAGEAWQASFGEVDANNNNAADWQELETTYNRRLQQAGWDREQVFGRFDRNSDGAIDSPEYVFFMTGLENAQRTAATGGQQEQQQQSQQDRVAQQSAQMQQQSQQRQQNQDQLTQQNQEDADLPRVSGITDWSEQDRQAQQQQGQNQVAQQNQRGQADQQQANQQQDTVVLQEEGREELQPNVAGLRDQSDQEMQRTQQDAVAQQNQPNQQSQQRQQDQMAQNMQGQQSQQQGQQGQQNQQAINQQGQQSPQGDVVTLVAVTTVQEVPIADIEDRQVVNLQGQQVGEVEDVVVSEDGSETGLVVSVGGFWDIGDKDIYVDLDDVAMRADQVIWETMVGEEELQDLPEYNEKDYVSVR